MPIDRYDPAVYARVALYLGRSRERQVHRDSLIAEAAILLGCREWTLEEYRAALRMITESLALANSADLDFSHALQLLLYSMDGESGGEVGDP